MIAHVVLFRPRAGVGDADQKAFLAAIESARREIPSVRRFFVGRRARLGHQYENLMTEDYPWAAIVEFDDEKGLAAYLVHPAHEALGRLLWATSEKVLVFDYAEIGSDPISPWREPK